MNAEVNADGVVGHTNILQTMIKALFVKFY